MQCEMSDDCKAPVTMLESKGYVYCTEHGLDRRESNRGRSHVRKLRPHELRKLERGEVLAKY